MDKLNLSFGGQATALHHPLKLLPAAGLLLVMSACASGDHWVHPEYTASQRRTDYRLCNRRAEALAPTAYRTIPAATPFPRYRPSSEYIGPNCGQRCAEKRANSYNSSQRERATSRVEAYKVVDERVVDDCMRALGYTYRPPVRG